MTTTTLTIPASHIPAVISSLLILYGTKAEVAHRTVTQHDDVPGALVDVRGQHWTLAAIGHLLNQLGWDATPRDGDQTVTGERDVIADALHGMLCDATEALDEACRGFLNGGGVSRLREQQQRVGDVLTMLTEIRPGTTAVELPNDLAERVHAFARQTGQTPSEVANAALLRLLQDYDEPAAGTQ